MEHDCTRRQAMIGMSVATLTFAGGCSTYGQASGDDPPIAGTSGLGSSDAATVLDANEVPVGGGVVLAEEQVVVCQPVAGTFVGYSALCTHAGCVVKDVTDGAINCPCHGSKFAVADGAVLAGPAPSALPERALVVKGGSITLGPS